MPDWRLRKLNKRQTKQIEPVELTRTQAQQLVKLVESLGLEESLRAELYERWQRDHQGWPQIRIQLDLLNSTLQVLKRLAS
jgi:hypothetical protein